MTPRLGYAAAALMAFLTLGGAVPSAMRSPGERSLRVCADPNDWPFSDDALDGFENKLAELVAGELHVPVAYTWWPQRRGFLRNTLDAHRCDVIMGIPATVDRVRTTRPYYRSGYAMILGPRAPRVRSLADPALRELRIGVPLVGDDGATTPPIVALARLGLSSHLHGYTVYGDYRDRSPEGDVVRAVRRGEVDVAIAWGPIAAGLAMAEAPKLEVVLLPEREAPAGQPFAFDIAVGVRREDEALAAEIDAALARRSSDIDRLLDAYSVPRPK